MSEVVIKVENLSKKYTIRHEQRERYTTLRDVLTNKAKSLGHRVLSPFALCSSLSANASREEFWALKDVSFEVNQGDRIGIIGRNGAGKTTLLKILSRITEPTNGRIKIQGRVASLLEVGTGFHPELTGRENIFLNGAILGMSKAEIKKKFDEIVDFAEIEKFLDTPVKRYSSGMYVRLAFAVAAHLEPEILLVDEVLAVGDAQFQKKCLGKMREVGEKGRTILFVSHNMSAIQSFCQRCLILREGCLLTEQPAYIAVQIYLADSNASDYFNRPKQINGKPTLISGRIKQLNYEIQCEVLIASDDAKNVSLDLRLSDRLGNPVGFGSLGSLDYNKLIKLFPGMTLISFSLHINHLALGVYFIGIDITMPDVEYYDRVDNCFRFEVIREAMPGATRIVSQSWGYGSLEIPLRLLRLEGSRETPGLFK